MAEIVVGTDSIRIPLDRDRMDQLRYLVSWSLEGDVLRIEFSGGKEIWSIIRPIWSTEEGSSNENDEGTFVGIDGKIVSVSEWRGGPRATETSSGDSPSGAV